MRAKRKAVLSDALVRGLFPEATKYLVWDERAPGLCVVVEVSGRKTYYFIYTRRGRKRDFKLGSATVLKVEDVRIEALDLARKTLLAPTFDPAAEKKANRGTVTFSQLHARYLKEHAKKENKSWKHTAGLIKNHALPKLGNLAAADITKSDVKKLLAAHDEKPRMREGVRLAISAVYTWAVREEIVRVNPCSGISRGADPKSRDRVLFDEEFLSFWREVDEFGLIISTALKVILLTGQRPGEVANMRWDHIHGAFWDMPSEKTKNKKLHRVFLTEKVLELIAGVSPSEVQPRTGFVFANRRGRPQRGLDGAMRRLSDKLGWDPPVRPHDLRRTFATTVTKLGCGRDAMNRIQNHSSGDAVGDIYDRHGYEDEDRRVMERVAAHFLRLLDGADVRAGVVTQLFKQ